MLRRFAVVTSLSLLLWGCAPVPESQVSGPAQALVTMLANQEQAEQAAMEKADAARFGVTVAQLREARASLPSEQRAKVASLLMVGVRDFDDAKFALNQGVGGIFVGSWTDPALLTEPGRDIAALREQVGRPFSVSIDAEGGRVQRQPALFGQVPAPRELVAGGTPERAHEVAFGLGTRLREVGVTVDFAPVLDVDHGSANGAIGDRSFSGDPAEAAAFGAAFARGLHDAGVHPVYKHFPGHGRASGDSHFEDVTAPPLDDVKRVDLAPYGPALREAPGAVMMGHVRVPGLGDATPSSINPAAYKLLRSGDYPGGEPFRGVIYTDDLSGMKAISAQLSTPDAVLAALSAGADCALWISTVQVGAAIDAVDAAVSSGAYPLAQVEDSAVRIRLQQLSS